MDSHLLCLLSQTCQPEHHPLGQPDWGWVPFGTGQRGAVTPSEVLCGRSLFRKKVPQPKSAQSTLKLG